MTDEDDETDLVRNQLDAAAEVDGDRDVRYPPSDPDLLQPDYPDDYNVSDRVDHVLTNEFPRWRPVEWIAAAADTDEENVRNVVRDRLAAGEVEISEEGIRQNRYHVYYEQVDELTEKARERAR